MDDAATIRFYLVFYVFSTLLATVSTYGRVEITSNAPIVVGGRVSIFAELKSSDSIEGPFQFVWSDDSGAGHEAKFETKIPESKWSVSYDRGIEPRSYDITVIVKKRFPILSMWYEVARGSHTISVTDLLNGNFTLLQNGTKRDTAFVAKNTPLNFTVSLENADLEFLERNSTYLRVYWFENCTYLGQTSNFSYVVSYDKLDEEYELEALVVASFDKLPDPTTTTTTIPTTTSTTTTTTTTSTTTTTTTTTTPKPQTVLNSNMTSLVRRSREISDILDFNSTVNISPEESSDIDSRISDEFVDVISMKSTFFQDDVPQSVCLNKSVVAPDPNKTYGYFHRKVIVKAPVANLTVAGSNWLQHGELLKLDIKCGGSSPFEFCIEFFEGPYNTTGNETCKFWKQHSVCNFSLTHLFQSQTMKTVVVAVRNSLAFDVTQFAVNFYQDTKQIQLSVIVVPVAFTLITVILVVFGVAYYIQNRNRFLVEVADFNFGETASVDMEYKTFQRRLMDSVRDACNLSAPDSSQGPGTSSDSTLKYNHMS